MRNRYNLLHIMRAFAAASYALPLFWLPGCGIPSFLVTPVENTKALKEEVVLDGKGLFPRKIVIVEVEGLLLNARSGAFLRPTENSVSLFTQQMHKAENDPAVHAVVLRVNSPGGTVSASDAMYDIVMRFRNNSHKPVVASAQDVAASGAYYVSCAADKLVVQPTSVLGSIGVIFHTVDISGTLAKIGARTEAIKSGPLKDMGSPLKPLSDPERAVMQAMVNEYYARFKNIVKTSRRLDDATLADVTDGRVFTGQQAVSLGLADNTGQLIDAIQLAKDLADSPDAEVVLYKRPHGFGGSIYASDPSSPPQSNVVLLNLEPSRAFLPSGFYYLWEPGLGISRP